MICWRYSDRTHHILKTAIDVKKANFLVRENSCCYSFCHLVFSFPCMKTLKGSLLAFIYDVVYAANMWHIAKPEVTAWIPHPSKFQIWTILLDNLHKHIQNVNITSSSMALKELNSVNDNDALPPLVHMHYLLISVVFLFLSVLGTASQKWTPGGKFTLWEHVKIPAPLEIPAIVLLFLGQFTGIAVKIWYVAKIGRLFRLFGFAQVRTSPS